MRVTPPLFGGDLPFAERLPEHEVQEDQNDNDDRRADIERPARLEQVRCNDNRLLVILTLTFHVADHHHDQNAEDTGPEHLPHKGQADKEGRIRPTVGTNLKVKCDRYRKQYPPDGSAVGGFSPEKSQHKYRQNTRTHDTGILLNILEYLSQVLQLWCQDNGDYQRYGY